MKTTIKYISLDSFLEKNPIVPTKKVIKPEVNFKTRLCRFEEIRKNSCRFGNKCMYAHNISEIVKRACFKGVYCKNSKCIFAHPKKEKEIEFEILSTEFPKVSSDTINFIEPTLNFKQIEWSEECFDTRKEFDCKNSKEILQCILSTDLQTVDTLIFNF